MLEGLGYISGEDGVPSSSSSSSGSRLAMMGERRPLNVLAEELALVLKSAQASYSSLAWDAGLSDHLACCELGLSSPRSGVTCQHVVDVHNRSPPPTLFPTAVTHSGSLRRVLCQRTPE